RAGVPRLAVRLLGQRNLDLRRRRERRLHVLAGDDRALARADRQRLRRCLTPSLVSDGTVSILCRFQGRRATARTRRSWARTNSGSWGSTPIAASSVRSCTYGNQ